MILYCQLFNCKSIVPKTTKSLLKIQIIFNGIVTHHILILYRDK